MFVFFLSSAMYRFVIVLKLCRFSIVAVQNIQAISLNDHLLLAEELLFQKFSKTNILGSRFCHCFHPSITQCNEFFIDVTYSVLFHFIYLTLSNHLYQCEPLKVREQFCVTGLLPSLHGLGGLNSDCQTSLRTAVLPTSTYI